MKKDALTVREAFVRVGISMMLVTVLFFSGRFSYDYFREKWIQDGRYKIVACVGRGHNSDAIASLYLQELMHLSVDQPISLYAFDTNQATRDLLRFPLFRKAKVQLLKPGIVVVDYALRKPVAEVIDYENMAVDKTGVTFPMAPFITPKKLVQLYLGALESRRIEKAFEIMTLFKKQFPKHYRLELIDVSGLFLSEFMKELVVRVETKGRQILLRLDAKRIGQELKEIGTLLDTIEGLENGAKLQVVDLRIPHIALIKEVQ
jgi:hypothetical protein